jgi:hypothetical protein
LVSKLRVVMLTNFGICFGNTVGVLLEAANSLDPSDHYIAAASLTPQPSRILSLTPSGPGKLEDTQLCKCDILVYISEGHRT